jgi:aminoglycoside phosphotransferase (APT) family kinase protein
LGEVGVLEQSDIAHYLLSLGVVKPSAIVDEELAIVDASRRNCVFIATTPAGPTHVVKQAVPRNADTLDHEAAVLRVLSGEPELAPLVPSVVHHDPDAALLVLATAGGARDWNKHHVARRFSPAAARLLGRTLAALHQLPGDGVESRPAGVDPMWGLLLPEPPHELLLDLSEAAQELVARLQASSPLCDALRRLADSGADSTLVHGDLRWDNCLAVAAPPSRRRTRVLLVDWELAGNGEAAFDVGTILGEYLRVWVISIPIVAPSDPARLLSLARYPLRRMQPAVNAFWTAYRPANPHCPPLRRAVELAAVHLLQTAVEYARGLPSVSAHAGTLVQLADNLLRAPEEAASGLLGLRA